MAMAVTESVLPDLAGRASQLAPLATTPVSARGDVPHREDPLEYISGLENLGKCIHTLEGHKDRVWAACEGPEGLVFTASEDATIMGWSVATGSLLQTLSGHTGYVHALAFDPLTDRLYSGAGDRVIRQWCTRRGRHLHRFRGHNYAVLTIALSEDGTRLYSGSHDRTVRCWNVATRECIRVMEGHSAAVWSLTCCGDRLFSGARDASIREWDTRSFRCMRVLDGHQDIVSSLVMGPDRTTLFSSSADGTIRVWNAERGEMQKVLVGHSDWVRSLALSTDGSYIYSGSCDGTVKVWRAATGDCVRTLSGHQGDINSVVRAMGDQLLVTASKDTTAKIWRLRPASEAARTITRADSLPKMSHRPLSAHSRSQPATPKNSSSSPAAGPGGPVGGAAGSGEWGAAYTPPARGMRRSRSVEKGMSLLARPRSRSRSRPKTPDAAGGGGGGVLFGGGGGHADAATPTAAGREGPSADDLIDTWQSMGARPPSAPGLHSMSFASEGDLEAVSCPICKEEFVGDGPMQPLLLPCGHTYCEQCLSMQSPLVCALCREPCNIPVSQLKKNFTLIDILRTLKNDTDSDDANHHHSHHGGKGGGGAAPLRGDSTHSLPGNSFASAGSGAVGAGGDLGGARWGAGGRSHPEGSTCEECGGVAATLVCGDCDMAYCAACCGAAHKATKSMSKHAAPVTLSEWGARASVCGVHGCELALYCGAHGEAICIECVPGHRGCASGAVVPVAEAAETYRASLRQHAEALAALQDAVGTSRQGTTEGARRLESELGNVAADVDERFDRLVADLRRQRAAVLTRLERCHLARMKRPLAVIHDMEEREGALGELGEEAAKALELGDAELLQVGEDLRLRLRSHLGSSEVTMPETPRMEAAAPLEFLDKVMDEVVSAWGMPPAPPLCTLCLRPSGGDSRASYAPLRSCRHDICAACLRGHLGTQLMYAELPLRCPLPGCGETLCAQDVDGCGLVAGELPERAVEAGPVWRCCPTAGCPGGCVWREGEPCARACGRCGADWCARCHGEAHGEGGACPGPGMGGAGARLVESGAAARCPRCQTVNQRHPESKWVSCVQCSHTWRR